MSVHIFVLLSHNMRKRIKFLLSNNYSNSQLIVKDDCSKVITRNQIKIIDNWYRSRNILGYQLAMFSTSRGLGTNIFFSWYEYSVSIELKMEHVTWKSIQKLVNLPNLMVIGLNAKAWYTFKIRELSMDWRTPVPPIHTKCAMPLGLNQ